MERATERPAPRPVPLVLNVDDDEIARYTKSRVLKEAGFEVLEIGTGGAALAEVLARDPDLVLLDIRLPDINGLEVCRRIKADPRTKHVMVLQTSASLVTAEDRVRGLEGGADHYLAQPFLPDELSATARALMRIRDAEYASRRDAVAAEQNASRLSAQNHRLELLAQATGDLITATDVHTTLTALFNRIAPEMGLDVYFHYVMQPDGSLALVSSGGVETVLRDAARVLAPGQAVCGLAARTGQFQHVQSISASPRDETRFLAACGVENYLCTPLLSNDRIVGTLGFGRRDGPPFDEDEVSFLRTLTGYVAIARERIEAQSKVARQAADLREADRRKDEFLAILGHELRNPLAPILNASEALRMIESADSRLGWVRETIGRQVGHMARLIDDLLDISRLTRGTLALRREIVDMRSVVTRAIESVDAIMKQRHHRLAVSVADGPFWVDGDPVRLVQVIENLLTNAAKFTDEGGEVDLALRREGDRVVVTVHDNGVGIAPGEIESIFELFVQERRSMRRSGGGLGIGLALVKQLVVLHGGTIEATSPGPGQGTTFAFRIALVQPPESVRPAPEVEPDVEPSRILIVDDEVDNAESLAAVLRGYGHEVRTCYDMPSALGLAREFQPRVALLDLSEPEPDGLEIARRLNEAPDTRAIVLLAVSGFGQPGDLDRTRRAGFSGHLVKPADPRTIQRLIRLAVTPAPRDRDAGGR